MSASIDKRIVEMQFDNKQFESGIQTSVKSLDQLRKGLDLEKAAKGLSGLEKAGRSFNLSGISDGISTISNRFSAMGIVGMTALQNITNAAYNCGKRMVSALTIDPVKTGFNEYETQIGAVQTILANTSSAMDSAGYSQQQRLDIVNSKLDELNAYADKTIYNFTEMTRNIGTFTAAGVELETSVSSIQGIANLAAVSGSTSQQASTAMYQLSQAISTGTVRLMDWNSVVNAGMGGDLFQTALMRTADNMGVVGDKAQEAFAKLKSGELSFRDSLSAGWLSSEILTNTLGQISMDFEKIAKQNELLLEDGTADIEAAKELMRSKLIAEGYVPDQVEEILNLAEMATDAATKVKTLTQLFDTMKESVQSGWTQSWEYVIGNFEEAKELLTNISDYFDRVIGKSADSRNAILADWKALGGRNELINSFWNVVHSIEDVVGVVRGAFQEFFPPTTGEQLFNITKKISDFTAKIKAATENSELMGKVSRIFRGAAAALDIVRTAAGWAWDSFKKLLGMTEGAAGGFLDFVAGIGDFVVGLRDSIKNSKTFQGILDGLGVAAASVRDLVVGGIKKVGAFFVNLWNKVKATGIFTKVDDWFNSFIGKIPEFIGKIGDWGRSISDWVKNSEALKTAWNNIKGFFEPIIDGIAKFGGKLWEAIQSFFGADTSGEGSLWDRMKARFTAFGTKIGEWFESLKPKLAEAWTNVKAFVSNLFTKTIPDFFANLKMKAITKWPWLDKVFSFFEESWNKVKEVCGPTVQKIKQLGVQLWEGIKNLFGGNKAPKEGELTFGESFMNIVTGAWEKIKTFFSTFVTTTIPNWFSKLDGINWGTVLKAALGLSTLWKIVSMASGFQKMGQGLKSLGSGLKDVGEMLGGINKDGITITRVFKNKDSFATSLLKIAGAIGVMVAAIVVLSNMEVGKAHKGIWMLTILASELLLVAAIFKTIEGENGVNGDAFIKMAAAVALLVVPIYLLGNMDIGTAMKGLIGVGLILTELGVFMKLAGRGMNGKQSFLGLAVAVNLLVLAVKGFGNMDTGAALKGVIGLGLVLLELSLFTSKTNTKKLSGMVSMAIAMNLLVRAVRKMGSLNVKTIIKGVLGLGGIMAAFALLVNSSKGMKLDSPLLMLLTMAGTLWMFTESIKQMDGVGWQTIAAFSGGLMGIVAAMTLAVKLLSGISPISAAKAAASLAIVAAGIGAAIAIIGGFGGSAISGLSDDVFRVGANLKAYGNMVSGLNVTKIQDSIAIMKNLAQMAADVALKDTSGLEGFTSQISLLGGRLALFNALVSGIDETGASYAEAMVDDIGAIVDKMKETQNKGVDLTTLGTALTNIGSGIELYSIACADANKLLGGGEGTSINADKITTLFSSLGDIDIDESTIAKVASYAQGGGNDLTNFAIGLTAIGNAVQSYKDSIKDIRLADSIKSTLVLGMINDLQNKLPRDGNSIVNWIAGEKQTLAMFSENLVVLGGAMNLFAGCFATDTAPLAERAVGVIDSLASIQNKLDDYGGVAAFFEGEKDLGDFGANINALGQGFASFINALDGFMGKDVTVSQAIEMIDSLSVIQSALEKTDGVAQWFTGTQNIGTFGANLNTFGTKFSEFCTSLSSIAIPDNMEDIQGIVDKFADVAVKLNGVKMTYNISDQIEQIGWGLESFFGDRKGIGGIAVDQTKIDSILSFVDSIANIVVKLNGINDVDVMPIGTLLANLTSLAIPTFQADGAAAADAYIECLVAGIQNGTSSVIIATTNLCSDGTNAANATYPTWLATGRYLGSGIANGIGSLAGRIRSAATNAAAGAIRAIQIKWSIHSPSKVGEELGEYWDLGIARGMDKYAKLIDQSSANIGTNAINSARSALNNLSYLTEDIGSEPTIRPVMDLTDITSGFQTIDGLFNSERTMNSNLFGGLSSIRNARSMTSDQGRIAYQSDNREVVAELAKLSKQLDELSAAVSNMQVVLDTGVLVGQTSAQMDSQLGTLASRRGRGN